MPSSDGHAAGDVRGLDQMAQHVLAVGRAVLEPADEGDQLRVQVGDPDGQHGVLGGPLAEHLDLVAGPLVGLLDAVRVDPAVLDQHFQGDPADLPADRVEARQQHRFRGVVDDDVDAGHGLEGADVAALAADDPALDLVGGQVHDGDHGLRGLVGGDPLDRLGDDGPGPLFGGVLGFRLDAPDHHGRVPADRFFLAGQQFGPGGFGGQTGDPDQLGLLRGARRGQLLLAQVQLLGASRQARPSPRPTLPRWPAGTLGVGQFALLGTDPPPVGDQRLLLLGQRLAGGPEPLLGFLQFLAVLGERGGGFDGDPVALGLQPGAQFGRLRARRGHGPLGLRPGVGPDLIGVPSRPGLAVRRPPRRRFGGRRPPPPRPLRLRG